METVVFLGGRGLGNGGGDGHGGGLDLTGEVGVKAVPISPMTTLYKQGRREAWTAAAFRNPGMVYRGAPFWSWNGRLEREQLFRQLGCLKAMGFGGAHLHPRVGLETEYLGEEFMGLVRDCEQEGRRLGMLTWLYDEDRWPSGSAGGLVTKDKRYRARHLRLTRGEPKDKAKLLWRYEVRLDGDGCLAGYRRLKKGEMGARGARVWSAYLETEEPTGWHNGQTYVDTLNAKAIERFIEITHERYRACVGKFFGKSVPAIFTDEPQFAQKLPLDTAGSERDVVLPYTDGLPASYAARFGERFEDTLPEVVWERPGGEASVARYRYHEQVAELFATAFAGTLAAWCGKHGLGLTGHMMAEPGLDSQTRTLGEAMRGLARFDLPGIDMLCDLREWNTAKQAQSVARQGGREGVMSELYGVTGWDFDFAGHKRQGDWQAAMGVTLRVPHLAWVTMAGEAKRDYPAAIGWQSPWHERYRLVEDHFARVNVAMTRGRPVVRVAVVHPIESYWLCFGPEAQTRAEREERETRFEQLTEWLSFGSVDFDLVAESLLPSQKPGVEGKSLRIGEMKYDVVIVPGLRTIRATTLEALEQFSVAGGRVVFAGEWPALVDAEASERGRSLARRCETVEFGRVAILRSLEGVREVEVRGGPVGNWREKGGSSEVFLYQLREDGKERYLFVCNTDRERGRPGTLVRAKGTWKATLLDTLTGAESALAVTQSQGWTEWCWDAPAHGSLLVRLQPGRRSGGVSLTEPEGEELGRLELVDGVMPVTLSEPNVLLLNQAEWRLKNAAGGSALDDQEWNAREEILRLDREVRVQLGLPPRGGKMKQPWADARPVTVRGVLELRFVIESEVEVAMPRLALEEPAACEITWNGAQVAAEAFGYFVDEAIPTVALPPVRVGRNELRIAIPMTRRRNVEWCYLLGDFGVKVRGRSAVVTAPVRELTWGDWTNQGLPFYAGNVTYHWEGKLPAGKSRKGKKLSLEVAHFAGPLVEATRDGRALGPLAFAPHRAELGAGGRTARVDLTVYGNRYNAFGPLHNTNAHLIWVGPDSWRTEGPHWAYEYQLKPMGILAAPRVLEE